MDLGIVEGFYGPLWSWTQRAALVAQLAPHGYCFYHYAPKADTGLRACWRERWPDTHVERLREFASVCRTAGMRFGVGLSPFDLAERFESKDAKPVAARLAQLDEIGIDDLLLAFDDIRGDDSNLAAMQAHVVDWAAARTAASRVFVCPTYYCDDPLLDRLFGNRPPDYLQQLGRRLDANVQIYWAGEEVCSRQFSVGHIERVSEILGRHPALWDNYPVNDGARMSRYLHLRGFTGRPAQLRWHLTAHAINPALQPTLSAVPALTLPQSYRLGPEYQYAQALRDAARTVLGRELAQKVVQDLVLLQDTGLDRLGDERAALRRRYGSVDHPAAREIVRWLDGEYQHAPETAPTQ